MAEALVKFFLQRLDSQETQMETFAGLDDQIERIKGLLREIAEFFGDRGSISHVAFSTWIDKLKKIVSDMDDQVDEFIIQIDRQIGSDRLASTECFRIELQKSESSLFETIQRIRELKNSTVTKEEKREKEDSNEQSHGREEGKMRLSSNTIEGPKEENEGNMEQFHEQEEENYWINKGKLIRLLVAEGLTQEKTGQLLEDVAEGNINELVNQGMLKFKEEHPGSRPTFTVSSPYRKLLHENFKTGHANSNSTIPHIACRVLASDMTKIGHSLNNLRPRSLFLFGNQGHFDGHWLDLTWAKFLRVLDLEDTKIKSLPDEVGDLVHLTYLGLKHCQANELPARLGKLRALQTLDIRWCWKLSAVSPDILNLAGLRHLKMSCINGSGMKLPEGIGRLRNLLTLTGLCAGGGIAGELDRLTQLTRLGVADVAEENAAQVYAAIIKMQGLLCLSLEAHHAFNKQQLVLLELFSPPPLLRKLRLEGALEKIPSWLGSMEKLTKLRLGFSHLSEIPMLVLQILPNLKILTLWHAYDTKQLGKEFCKAGGFPKLEVLRIASYVLEEWTELEEGALPSLQCLHFHNCSSLRILPEGLQYVTTLKQLKLLPLLDEHAERLKPDGGEENYKIRHIATISFIPMSVLSLVSHPCHQTQEASED
eukprot:XP_025014843.1 probable disease resistance RPP8-like protein 2 isoform X1 [Ricinus communis]